MPILQPVEEQSLLNPAGGHIRSESMRESRYCFGMIGHAIAAAFFDQAFHCVRVLI
jgi:hypothetical protein